MLIFLFLLPSALLAAESLKYDDLERLILNKNRKVTAAQLDVSAAESRLGHLRRSFLPTGEASVGSENFQTGPYHTLNQPTYSLRAKLNLYRGGRDSLEEKGREAAKKGFEFQTQQVIQEELLKVRRYYWDLVYLRELKGILEHAIQLNHQNLNKALKRINAGLTTKVDQLEFEISETQLKQDLTHVEVEISNSQRMISALLGKAPETQYQTIDMIPHYHEDETSYKSIDAQNFRDVQLELANQTALTFEGTQLKRWWTPSLDLYAQTEQFTFREREYFTQEDRVDNAIGFTVSIGFDGFQQQVDGQALVARGRAAELRAGQIKAEVEASFATARQELILLHKLIHEGELSVKKGMDYLDATLSEYTKGIKNSPDVLSAMQKNLEFKRRFAELRRDYAVTKAQLESLLAKNL